MKVGDLIRYNAADSRNKTLGLVIERKPGWLFNEPTATIQWLRVARYMPRACSRGWDASKPTPGDICSHPQGSWFEVVS